MKFMEVASADESETWAKKELLMAIENRLKVLIANSPAPAA